MSVVCQTVSVMTLGHRFVRYPDVELHELRILGEVQQGRVGSAYNKYRSCPYCNSEVWDAKEVVAPMLDEFDHGFSRGWRDSYVHPYVCAKGHYLCITDFRDDAVCDPWDRCRHDNHRSALQGRTQQD
eukprot:jgi/Mesen1/1812/ME000140S00752